jgi:hypothetical protein
MVEIIIPTKKQVQQRRQALAEQSAKAIRKHSELTLRQARKLVADLRADGIKIEFVSWFERRYGEINDV